jgi:hypothetical protein
LRQGHTNHERSGCWKAAGIVVEARMKRSFIALLCFLAGPAFSTSITVAQPSVYSGIYAYGEGRLSSSSNWFDSNVHLATSK